MTSVCGKQTPVCMKQMDVVLAFLFVHCATGVWNILMKGGTRMKRKVNVRSGKRTTRPAARRQQIMRKEEREQAKHRQVIYVSTALARCRNRGA